jgi:hypothetical protein
MQARWAEFLDIISSQIDPFSFAVLRTAARVLAHDGNTVTLGTAYPENAPRLEDEVLPRLHRLWAPYFPGTTFRVQPLNGEAGSGLRPGDAGSSRQDAKAQRLDAETRSGKGEEEDEGQEDAAVEVDAVTDPALARFDVSLAGWSKLANYAMDFWAELLGPIPFLTWLAIRREDIRRTKTEWTPTIHFSASHLARLAANGSRQAITGVWRTCRAASIVERGEPCPRCAERGSRPEGRVCRFWKPGAMDRLQAEGVAVVERRGQGLHVTYRLRVFSLLPLLTPAQVLDLHPATQQLHSRWLLHQGLDPASWERLTVRHLALPPL